MKRLLLIVALLSAAFAINAQDTLHVAPVADTIDEVGIGRWRPAHDTVYLLRTDTVTVLRVDSVYIVRSKNAPAPPRSASHKATTRKRKSARYKVWHFASTVLPTGRYA